MRAREIVVRLSGCLVLVAGVLLAAPPAVAERPAGTVTASASVVGTRPQVEVASEGDRAVVLSVRGGRGHLLTSYALDDGDVTRSGTASYQSKAPYDDGFVRLDPQGDAAYVRVGGNLVIYDLTGRTPKRVSALLRSSLFPGSSAIIADVLFAADGRTAWVATTNGLRVLDTRRAAHPVVGASAALPEGSTAFAVTSVGRPQLVVGGSEPSGVPAPPDSPAPRHATISVYDLDRTTGEPTLVRRGAIRIPGRAVENSTRTIDLTPTGDVEAVYVRVADAGPHSDDFPPQVSVLRVRLSDLAVRHQLSDTRRTPLWMAPSVGGKRLYLIEGFVSDEDVSYPGRLRWATRHLDRRHPVVNLGNVQAAGFASADIGTKSRLYVVARKPGAGLRLSALYVH